MNTNEIDRSTSPHSHDDLPSQVESASYNYGQAMADLVKALKQMDKAINAFYKALPEAGDDWEELE